MLEAILKGLGCAAGVYFIISIIGIISIYCTRNVWNPEFRKGMKSLRFWIILFLYSPISLTKSIFGEVKE